MVMDDSYFQSQADWHYIKGEQESAQGFFNQAVESFKQALIYRPNSFFLHFRLADEYLRAELYLQAFEQCNNLLKKQPDNVALRLKLGKIYEKNHLYKKAQAEYGSILKKNPHHIKTLYQKAFLHIQTGELAPARSVLTTLSRLEENNLHKIHYLLFKIDTKAGRNLRALSHLKKSLHFQPDFAESAFELSSYYRKTGRIETAIQILEELQKNTGFSPRLSFALFYLHIQQKNQDKAIRYLQPFLEAHPNNWLFPLQLVGIWGRNGEYDKIPPVFEKILSAYPRASSKIYTLYARFFEHRGNFSKALDILSKAASIFPNDTNILFHMGFVYDRLGQTKQVVKWMKKVLKLDTGHVEALNHLAFIYAESNENLESAEQMVAKALSVSPDDSYILDTAGWVFFKRGKIKKALEYLERAYRNNTSAGFIAEHLAEVYYHLNMIDKSIALYKKAIGLETNENKRKQLEKKLLSIQVDV